MRILMKGVIAKRVRPRDVRQVITIAYTLARNRFPKLPRLSALTVEVLPARSSFGLALRARDAEHVYLYVLPGAMEWCNLAHHTRASLLALCGYGATVRAREQEVIDSLCGARAWEPPPERKPRAKATPSQLARLAVAQQRVTEWEAKQKVALRNLKLAHTKLKRYRAQVRSLEREVQKPQATKGMPAKDFAALMRTRRAQGVISDSAQKRRRAA